MRYEDMPKGRNKDRCVRCGKRYNFADKALSKAKVPYDLLCLAEVTTSGYMTHGNVKLCDECMTELLMWLDRKTENSSEKPNNCELQTIRCPKCGRTDYIRDMEKDMGIKGSHYKYKCINCNTYIKTEPTISKMEQVEEPTEITYQNCSDALLKMWMDNVLTDAEYNRIMDKLNTEIAKAIVHKMIDDAVLAEDAYPDLRQKMHDAVDEYEPQTDCAWK